MNGRPAFVRFGTGVLACVLVASALLKLVLPLEAGRSPLADPVVAAIVAAAELCVAWGLVARRGDRWPFTACVGIAAVGVLWRLLYPSAPCGCFGRLELSPQMHTAIASLLGLLAVLLAPTRHRAAPGSVTRGAACPDASGRRER